MTGKKELYLGGMILIIVLLAFSSPSFFQKAPGSFLGSVIDSSKVYVPRFGSVWCEETTTNVNDRIYGSWNDSYKKEIEAVRSSTVWTIPLLNSHQPSGIKLMGKYTCGGAWCDLSNPSESNFQCFSSEDDVVYDIIIQGDIKERHGSGTTGATKTTSPQISGGTLRFFENQTLTVYASCVGEAGLLGTGVTRAKTINIPIVVKNKELIRYLDGTKIKESGTLGCTYQSIQNKALENVSLQNQLKSGSVIKTVVEGSLNLVSGKNYPITLPSSIPVSMNAGQSYNFIFEWRGLSSLNVLTLSNGIKVYREPATKTLYKVEPVQSNSGTINVAGSVYKTSVDCINNDECIKQNGSGYFCDVTETFKCNKNPNYCNFDADCGSPQQYVTINNTPFVVENKCINNACNQTQTQLVCNPTASYPYNNCPQDEQVCINNGTQCIAQVIPKTACVSDCCIEGDPQHYAKDCPSGLVCQTNGTWAGTCVSKPTDPKCGDGVCSEDIGETPLTCSVDCGGDETTQECGLFEKWGTVSQPAFKLWFLEFGQVQAQQCVTDWTLILLLVLFFLFLLAIVWLFWATRKGRKRGRK